MAEVEAELAALADPARAKKTRNYFQTGDGMLGIPVPEQRRIARRHRELPSADLGRLLASEVHEHRFTALAILRLKYERADEPERKRVARFYLDHRDRVNDWDLVDASAPYILGDRLRSGSRAILDRLVRSESRWDRRIAVVATFALIRDGEVEPTMTLAGRLVDEPDDLVQKAVGWMLREAGKRDQAALRSFLDANAAEMPRTMLRYSLERLSAEVRATYMRARAEAG